MIVWVNVGILVSTKVGVLSGDNVSTVVCIDVGLLVGKNFGVNDGILVVNEGGIFVSENVGRIAGNKVGILLGYEVGKIDFPDGKELGTGNGIALWQE